MLGSPRPIQPRTLASLARLGPARRGPSPLLTYRHPPSGERTELSGATVHNWVSKTANHLLEELHIAVGDPVRVRATPHWRTVVAGLAVWRAGGILVPDSDPAALWAGDEVLAEADDFDDPDVDAGAPALAALSHLEVLEAARRHAPAGRLLVTVPLDSPEAWIGAVVAPLLGGGATVLLEGADDDVLRAVAAEERAERVL